MFLLFFVGQFQQALEQAKVQEKSVLIAFSAEWCGPCKVFHQDAQEDEELKSQLSKFVFLEMAIETEEGKQAKDKYHIRSFPGFLLLSCDGEVIYRWKGYEKAALISLLQELQTDQRSLEARLADFKKQPKIVDCLRLADYYGTAGEHQLALPFVEKAIELGGENALEFELFSTQLGIFAQGQKDFKELVDHANRAMANLDDLHLKILVCDRMCWAAKKANKRSQIFPLLERGLALAKQNPGRYQEFIHDFENILEQKP